MDKERELRKLKEDCIAFFKDISKFNDQLIVFGQGNPEASIVLVGEAPGRQEVLKQAPFIGKAGENLNEFLKILDIKRQDIYITNAVKFRPVKFKEHQGSNGRFSNRAPVREEIDINRGWLYKEIKIIKPDLIVSLGNIALRVLSGDDSLGIGQAHGVPLKARIDIFGDELPLFPLYHPASVIYRRELKGIYLTDLLSLKHFISTQGHGLR